ncbi:MAG: hypothetical protein KatS3mg061_0525 [Dehalococcoidia bacterium]|nr:MAG: hypothetical protein KatS3mg061_0525 [Dehalococcoidia bacterium]
MAAGHSPAPADRPAGYARPFSLLRDLGPVLRLIEQAFGEEGREERLAGFDLLALRLAAPLLSLLGRLVPPIRDLFAGVVWEDHGQIVGNVTLSRVAGDRQRWMLGNVAVDAAYRRRGIARQLTLAALREIERRGGELVLLDVRADNEPAYALYRSLGFHPIDRLVELRHPPLSSPPPWPPLARLLRPREWRALWWLYHEATPVTVQRYLPVLQQQVLASALAAGLGVLGRPLLGHSSRIVVIAEGRSLAAAAEIELHGGERPHRARLVVHPFARGRVEEQLVTAVLALAARPRAALRAETRADQTALIAALERAGFQPSRVLDRLVLTLGSAA